MENRQALEPPLFAIAVCTRDRATFDANCAHGLAGLTLPEKFRYVVILVENNSIATPSEAEETVSGMQLCHFVEPRQGLAFARNCALAKAEHLGALWLAFVDDDARPLPDWISEFVAALSRHPRHVFFYGSCWYQYPDGFSAAFPRDPGDLDSVRHQTPKFGGGNLLLHRDVFDSDIGNLRFDPRFNGCGGEDIDFRRQATAAKIAAFPVPTAVVVEQVEGRRAQLTTGLARHVNHGVSSMMMAKKHGSLMQVVIGMSVHLPKLLIQLLLSSSRVAIAYLWASPSRQQLLEETLMAGARLLGICMAICGYRGRYYTSKSKP